MEENQKKSLGITIDLDNQNDEANIIEIRRTGNITMEYDKERQAFALTIPLTYKAYLNLDMFKEPYRGFSVSID